VSDTTLEGITGRAVVSAGVNSAVLGGSFGQGLVDSVVADASAIGANGIGGTWGATGTDPNAAAQALAHGALGCAQGALTGGNCAAGAAGAAAESVLGDVVTAAGGLPTDANGQVTTGAAAAYETGAAALGALAGQAAGGDAQSGLNTAVNSAANNYVYHASILPGTKSEAQQLQDAQAGCARGDSSACATATALTQTSTSRDQELATACQQPGSMGCLFQKSLAYLAGNTIGTVDGVTVATPEQTPVYTPPSQQAATLDNMLGSPLAGILGGITYAAGGATSTAYYVTTLGVATDGIAAGVAGLGGTSSVNVVDEARANNSTLPDFYVTSEGVVIPATGYRAVSPGPATQELMSGVISPRPGGTYITFNNISSMSGSEVRSLLQMPKAPTSYAEFDTLQLLPDLSIPGEKWNTLPAPEPLTSTFPEYGAGKGTQAITSKSIIIRAHGPLSSGGANEGR
jgi:filamentous hemagglutinin